MAVLDKVFKAASDHGASDIHIVPGEPFTLRRLGQLVKLKSAPLTAEKCRQLIFEILTPDQRTVVEQTHQVDFGYAVEGLARFRGSVMAHNNGLSAVFRVIPPEIPGLEQLGLPEVVTKILDNHQGLILVTGATGQGKSTTLAAMVDYINTGRSHHILTVEDPIEFLHPLKKGVVINGSWAWIPSLTITP
jgi:twitching motility protein PilT